MAPGPTTTSWFCLHYLPCTAFTKSDMENTIVLNGVLTILATKSNKDHIQNPTLGSKDGADPD